MVDPVKEFLQVDVHHNAVIGRDQFCARFTA